MVNGHSHHRRVLRVRSLTVINVGTLDRMRDPCCAVMDCSLGQIVFRHLVLRAGRELLEVLSLS